MPPPANSHPTVYFIKALNALQSLFNWLGRSVCFLASACVSHKQCICTASFFAKRPVCDVVIKQNDVCLSWCAIFFFHSLCVSRCCRVNGTICWWMWNGTTASQRCPTPSTSTWCRIVTMRMVRLHSEIQNTPAHVHIYIAHKYTYFLSHTHTQK